MYAGWPSIKREKKLFNQKLGDITEMTFGGSGQMVFPSLFTLIIEILTKPEEYLDTGCQALSIRGTESLALVHLISLFQR